MLYNKTSLGIVIASRHIQICRCPVSHFDHYFFDTTKLFTLGHTISLEKDHQTIELSKLSQSAHTSSPLGTWTVLGPDLDTSLLTSRILAKVPLDMMSSFPRRAPYELNSLGVKL